jgi:hypothetical protein
MLQQEAARKGGLSVSIGAWFSSCILGRRSVLQCIRFGSCSEDSAQATGIRYVKSIPGIIKNTVCSVAVEGRTQRGRNPHVDDGGAFRSSVVPPPNKKPTMLHATIRHQETDKRGRSVGNRRSEDFGGFWDRLASVLAVPMMAGEGR